MDTNENSSNSNDGATSAQPASAGINRSEVVAAVQKMNESLSRYLEEDRNFRERLLAVLKQEDGQLRATDAKTVKNSAEIERLSTRISNYRS